MALRNTSANLNSLIQTVLTFSTVVCVFLLGYFLFDPNYAMARSEYPWIYFLIGVFFFNTTHIFITFIKIFKLPEYKTLSFLKSKVFLLRCFLMFAAPAFITFFCLRYSQQSEYLYVILRVFIFASTIHHANLQTYGLSSQLDISNRANGFEKYAVLGFTALAAFIYTLARLKFQTPIFYFALLFAAAWILISGYLIAQTKRALKFDKFVFLGRYLCVFLSFIHPILTLVSMTFHGLEYVQTFLKVRGHSQMNPVYLKATSLILWILIPSTALFIHFATLSTLIANFPRNHLSLLAIESVMIGLNTLHYFLDAKIYQFRNPEVREKIAPLFKTA